MNALSPLPCLDDPYLLAMRLDRRLMPRKLSISPELKALSHTLDALDWASSVDSKRVDDVQRVCGFAANEARDILLGDLLNEPHKTLTP